MRKILNQIGLNKLDTLITVNRTIVNYIKFNSILLVL